MIPRVSRRPHVCGRRRCSASSALVSQKFQNLHHVPVLRSRNWKRFTKLSVFNGLKEKLWLKASRRYELVLSIRNIFQITFKLALKVAGAFFFQYIWLKRIKKRLLSLQLIDKNERWEDQQAAEDLRPVISRGKSSNQPTVSECSFRGMSVSTSVFSESSSFHSVQSRCT